jgi:Fic family protein
MRLVDGRSEWLLKVREGEAMSTLRQFLLSPPAIPATAVWYLTDLAEFKGRQELFTRQAPQRLKALREHALIESAVSSNRIEGVQIDAARVATVVFGRPFLQNRDEEEVSGYRNALALIHEGSTDLPMTEETVRQLHELTRGEIWTLSPPSEPEIRPR